MAPYLRCTLPLAVPKLLPAQQMLAAAVTSLPEAAVAAIVATQGQDCATRLLLAGMGREVTARQLESDEPQAFSLGTCTLAAPTSFGSTETSSLIASHYLASRRWHAERQRCST